MLKYTVTALKKQGIDSERLEAALQGRGSVSVRGIAELPLPVLDRVSLLIRLLSEREARGWAAKVARDLLNERWGIEDRRPFTAVEIASRFAVGKANEATLDHAQGIGWNVAESCRPELVNVAFAVALTCERDAFVGATRVAQYAAAAKSNGRGLDDETRAARNLAAMEAHVASLVAVIEGRK